MSKEPWKRAATLSRLRQAGAYPGPLQPGPADYRAPRPVWPWIALLLLAAGTAGWYVWRDRGVLIPKYAPKLPEPAAQVVQQAPLPLQEIDVAALDSGCGIGLAIGGNYLDLIGATRAWGVPWKLIETGSGHTRLEAPGLTVQAAGGRISGYTLDIGVVFKDEHWQQWRKSLADTGLSPELNWRTATGEAQMPHGVTEHVITGRGGHDFGGNPATSAYTLHFRDGWLKRVEAGLSTGNIPPPIIEHPPPAQPPTAGTPAPNAKPAGSAG